MESYISMEIAELEEMKAKEQVKLEEWDERMSTYVEQTADISENISETGTRKQLLEEKIHNLFGMMMGCEQKIATIVSLIEEKKITLEKNTTFGFIKSDPSAIKSSIKVTEVQYSILFQDADFPGMVFFENPKKVTLTAQEQTVNLEEELGISLHIPEGAIDAKKPVDLIVQPSFSGSYAGPENLEPVSPAYLIHANKEINFMSDITIRLQHSASIQTSEDCEGLVFLTATCAPLYRGPLYGPLYVFHEADKKKVKFCLEDGNFGEIQIDYFCWLMIWREKKKENDKRKDGFLYSARLYKGGSGFKNKAVFCMCQQHPQYTKYCDIVMARDYSSYGIISEARGRIVKDAMTITGNGIFLEGESPSCLIEMEKEAISKREIDIPRIRNMSIVGYPDYPPRTQIHLTKANPEIWTLGVEGLTEAVQFVVLPYQMQGDSLSRKRKEKLTKASSLKQPTLKSLSLIKWKDEQGNEHCFRFIDTVSDRWKDFATQLEIPESKLTAWEDEYCRNTEKCWKKVMNFWLKGKGKGIIVREYPDTWEGLYLLLKDIKLNEVADELRKALASV